jgi:hypothetical protein
MPITFDQPDPMSNDTSYQTGMVDQWNQNLPQMLQNQQQALDTYKYNRSQSDEEQQSANDQGEKAYEFDQSQQPNARDLWQSQDAVNQMKARVDLHEQMRQQELSFDENNQYKKMNEAKGHINQAVSDGTLTPEEGNNFMLQLQTKIDPYAERFKASQAAKMQSQADQASAAEQQQLAKTKAAESFNSLNVASRIKSVPLNGKDGDDGWVVEHQEEPGKYRTHIVPPPKEAKAPAPKYAPVVKYEDEARKEVMGEIAASDKYRKELNTEYQAIAKATPKDGVGGPNDPRAMAIAEQLAQENYGDYGTPGQRITPAERDAEIGRRFRRKVEMFHMEHGNGGHTPTGDGGWVETPPGGSPRGPAPAGPGASVPTPPAGSPTPVPAGPAGSPAPATPAAPAAAPMTPQEQDDRVMQSGGATQRYGHPNSPAAQARKAELESRGSMLPVAAIPSVPLRASSYNPDPSKWAPEQTATMQTLDKWKKDLVSFGPARKLPEGEMNPHDALPAVTQLQTLIQRTGGEAHMTPPELKLADELARIIKAHHSVGSERVRAAKEALDKLPDHRTTEGKAPSAFGRRWGDE